MGHVACANNAWGNIAASIGLTDTTISLTSGQGARFPSTANGDWFYTTLIDPTGVLEIVKVTDRTTDILTVVRGVDTEPHAFPAGSAIELRPVAAWFRDFLAAFMARDGQYPATGDTDLGGFAIVNLKQPVNPQDAATKKYVDDTVAAAVAKGIPMGAIILWDKAAIPEGWAIATGANGTTVDLRDKFVVGAGAGYAILATGGAATVVLSEAQMPSHQHAGGTDTQGWHSHGGGTGGGGWHQHGMPDGGVAQAGGDNGGATAASGPNQYGQRGAQATNGAGDHSHAISGDGNHAHNFSTDWRGGNQAHENRPPYTALYYIQKVY